MMKVLVACEFSGTVRDAFAKLGHDAWSCDVLPSRSPGNHLQCDVLDIINDGWDLMIAHPPCTYLSYAGTRHWNNPGRCELRLKALEFFRVLWEANINKICIENPRGCASPTIAKYSQMINPYYFGDEASKPTWLWLKNLPLLEHNKDKDLFGGGHVDKGEMIYTPNGSHTSKWYSDNKDPLNRAKTFQGIANAMAQQWGNLC